MVFFVDFFEIRRAGFFFFLAFFFGLSIAPTPEIASTSTAAAAMGAEEDAAALAAEPAAAALPLAAPAAAVAALPFELDVEPDVAGPAAVDPGVEPDAEADVDAPPVGVERDVDGDVGALPVAPAAEVAPAVDEAAVPVGSAVLLAAVVAAGLSLPPRFATTRYPAIPAATTPSPSAIHLALEPPRPSPARAGLVSCGANWSVPTTTWPHVLMSLFGLLRMTCGGLRDGGTTSWLTESSIVESCPLSGRFVTIDTSVDGGSRAYHSRAMAA